MKKIIEKLRKIINKEHTVKILFILLNKIKFKSETKSLYS